MNLSGSGLGLVTCCYHCDNEPLGSIKAGAVPEYVRDYKLLTKNSAIRSQSSVFSKDAMHSALRKTIV